MNQFGPFEHPRNTFLREASGFKGVDYLCWWNDVFHSKLDESVFRAVIILYEPGHVTGAFHPDSKSGRSENYARAVIRNRLNGGQ